MNSLIDIILTAFGLTMGLMILGVIILLIIELNRE